jgi:PhnB protein
MNLNPYLLFKGECEAAFKFYEQTFGGKITGIMKYAGSPGENNVPANWRDKVMHVHLTIGDQSLMGSDPPPDYYQEPAGFSVAINLKDAAEAERIFNALSSGGNITMPLEKTFWASRFGMVTDRFRIPWMINCE